MTDDVDGRRDAPTTTPGESEPKPEIEARSVLSLDAEGRLGPGVELRDLAEETPLPPLQQGPEKYRVLAKLGEGGMGTVYLAYDQDLKRRVALKMVKAARADHAQRFFEEAQVMAQLDHPNIVPVFEGSSSRYRRLGERGQADPGSTR